MHEAMAGKVKLWNVVRMLLVLSHGQAAVERGFSINKQAEEVHLQAETFVAKRIICDHVGYVDGIDQADVACRELLQAGSSDRNTTCTLKNQRKKLKQNNQIKRGRLYRTRLRN